MREHTGIAGVSARVSVAPKSRLVPWELWLKLNPSVMVRAYRRV